MKMLGRAALLVAALGTASMAEATTYLGTRVIGDFTVNLKFVTDGTIGTLDILSLTEFEATITGPYNGHVTLVGPTVELSGGGLSATPTSIEFDFSKPAIFSVFGVPAGYYCVVGTGYGRACDAQGFAEEGVAGYDQSPPFSLVYQEVAGSGVETLALASVVNPGIPEPASWAMLIAGFGLVGAAARRRRSLAA